MTEDLDLTEETCECNIDYGVIENSFGQTVCEHCEKEKEDDRY